MDLRKHSRLLGKELNTLLADIEKGIGIEVSELPPKQLMPIGARFFLNESGVTKEYIKLNDGEYHLLGGGGSGTDAREIQLQKSATHIQWRYEGETTWTDLVALSEITGPTGATGTAGTNGVDGTDGEDGQEVQLRVDSGYIQWKYEDDVSWTNLVLLEDLKGDTGETGAAGQSIHHTSFTSTTAISGFPNEPGETDTYTVWGDVGETINLGTFTVYNGDDGVGGGGALVDLTDVDASSPSDGQVLTYNTATSKWIPTNSSGVAFSDWVDFVAASGTVYVTSTTTDETVPAGVEEDDLILLFIMHRDTLSAITGYTLVTSAFINPGSFNHTLSVYKKTASVSDAGSTVTVVQATSQRMCLHILALRSRSNLTIDVTVTDSVTKATNVITNNPLIYTPQLGDFSIIASTWNLAAASPATSTNVAPIGYILTTVTTADQNRLAVACRNGVLFGGVAGGVAFVRTYSSVDWSNSVHISLVVSHV